MPNLGGPELLLILVIVGLFGGVPALITWRRGGSAARIAAALLIGLVPYVGWLISWVIAFTTRREKKCPQCAEGVRSEALICPHCQYRFGSPPANPSVE